MCIRDSGKSNQILKITHFKRESRRYEEEIEQPDPDEGSKNRRATAENQRYADHGEQEEHDDIGQLKHAQQGRRQ